MMQLAQRFEHALHQKRVINVVLREQDAGARLWIHEQQSNENRSRFAAPSDS
ncbi:MAG: hypothetical protein HC933_07650 [Pleurocapsa sp. SU_196_0]|nr:hypothetical protein [Pleurocapsa sp. SU_196_0]